ncbi:MAG: bifunctional riboflavin kinase/FAD synthetase [Deltaproteobacteria bacterium]|nr:bifunctional riboflavin kinase/FAD synthetase [Deltaproteobacteria bacterium]
MRVFEGSGSLDGSARGCVLTVGNFDGLHLGHRALLDAVLARAAELGRDSALYTFDPHPRRLLFPEQAQPSLMTRGQLRSELESIGIDVLVREAFDHAFAALSPEEFLRDVIVARVGPAEIFVGRDFHFGKGRAGSGDWLRDSAAEHGIRVEIIGQVRVGDDDVSSTRVRRCLLRGDVEEASRCLDREYTIWGRVVQGDRRGRTLGFPTANLAPENELLPANGVYATRVAFLEGDRPGSVAHPAVTNIGTRPTFEPGRVLVETHLLDYAGDLYERRIAVAFARRIRAERRFSGPEELARQIALDAAEARRLLAASPS